MFYISGRLFLCSDVTLFKLENWLLIFVSVLIWTAVVDGNKHSVALCLADFLKISLTCYEILSRQSCNALLSYD